MHRRNILRVASVAAHAVVAGSAFGQVFTPLGVRRALESEGVPPPPVTPKPAKLPGPKSPFTDSPRGSFGTVRVDDEVFILGGHTGHAHCYLPDHFTDQFLAYNLSTKAWRELPKYPFPVQSPNLVRVGNSIYSFGGYRYDSAFHYIGCKVSTDSHGREVTEQEQDTFSARSDDRVVRFDLTQRRWELVAHMPRRRSSGVAYLAGSNIFLLAGWDGTPSQRGDRQGKFHGIIDVFDTKTNSFTKYESRIALPLRRALTSADMNGKCIMVGGINEASGIMQNLSSFDPVSGRMSELGVLPSGRFAAGACYTGRWLVVAGGLHRGESVILFDPQTGTWRNNTTQLSPDAMFIDLIPLAPDRVLVLGGFPAYMPEPILQELQISPAS